MPYSYKPSQEEIKRFHDTVDNLKNLKEPQKKHEWNYPDDQTIGQMEQTTAEQTIKYCSKKISRENYKMLTQGKIPIEKRLDLHETILKTAIEKLTDFIENCQKNQTTCALIIHGKGRNSQNKKPLLKTWINHALKQHPRVLAFHSTQNKHGGTGAIYLLLE